MIIINLRRPKLNRINLEKVVDSMLNGTSGECRFFMTMSIGQWDSFLENAYYKQNATLIEVNAKEEPVAVYKYITKTSQ